MYHNVRVKDVESEVPSLESVLVMREFPEIFPNEFHGIPTKWEMDIGIELLLDTNPISIPHFQMALAELKDSTKHIYVGCSGIFCEKEKWVP